MTPKVLEVDRDNPIVVTGQGMVSSLGLDAATSAAAARAGIRRAQPLDCLRIASLDRRSAEPVVGHAAPVISLGFEGAPRLAQLAGGALRDLRNNFSIPPQSIVGFYVSMPSCRRHLTGADLIDDDVFRRGFLENASDPAFSEDDESWSSTVLSMALPSLALPRESKSRFISFSGNTGFSEALARAVEDLNNGVVDLAIVGAVDSLVEERALLWLKNTGRLKTEANPTGVEPGEAAMFLTVEFQKSAKKREIAAVGKIEKIVLAEDQHSRLLAQRPTGKTLGDCIRSASADASDLWLVSDHNGEPARAVEFGNSLARALSVPGKQLLPTLYPAVSFGDTGAASGGVAACLALSAFSRGYAPAERALISSTSDGTQRSAFSLVRVLN